MHDSETPDADRRLERLVLLARRESPTDPDAFEARLRHAFPDLHAGLCEVYGESDLDGTLDLLLELMLAAHQERPDDLRRLDLARTLAPDWFQSPRMLGYACYTERFAGTLVGVGEHLDYLRELGVTYLHLMPLLRPRPAPHDGGYAVADYRAVREDLGSMADLERLTKQLREAGISLCLDLVINHVAREHAWAGRARAGDETYQGYFHMFEGREEPDRYEESLPEVFPDFAPGNFTFDDASGRWVWTTFNAWQWDLNWANPGVFLEFADLILYLANRGVEVFRLDAIAFIWKRPGTDCQNLPEVHAITQALRAVARIVAPAVAFKAEAIVAPEELIHYLGTGKHFGRVSDLAYHNGLMVQLWSSLASRDARLIAEALRRFPVKPPGTAWATYLRGHDDIGWAVSDRDAASLGWSGEGHRRFLSDFYAGDFPGSFARGLVFQGNPRTGDRRISGTAASLAGLERALEAGDEAAIRLSLERLLLGHAVVLGHGGLPVLFMGDELALLNDPGYLLEPEHAADNRWVHRPRMDWEAAGRRSEPGSVEARMYGGLRRLIEARRRTPHLHAATGTVVHESANPHLLIHERPHHLGPLVSLYNFSEEVQRHPASLLLERGLLSPLDRITGRAVPITEGQIELEPYGRLWLTQNEGGG